MSEEDKKKVEEDSPQIIEMKQTMQEMSKRLAQATELITAKDTEIEEMRTAKVKVVDDKLAKEKDLKEAFGLKNTAGDKTSLAAINSLSNVEMMEVFAEGVEKSINATRQEAEIESEKALKTLDDKFDNLQNHIIKTEAHNSLQEIRAANPDFDKYKTEIGVALERFPQMNYQEAYTFVISQVGKGDIADKHIASEKPDKDLSAADEAVKRVKKTEPTAPKARRRFYNSFEDAAAKVIERRGGKT